MIGRPKFVLASGSPRRLALINQAGIEPDALKPVDIDETPKRGEIPRAYATRLAHAKAFAALEAVKLDDVSGQPYVDRLSCELREQVMALCTKRKIELYASFRSEREEWVQYNVIVKKGANGMEVEKRKRPDPPLLLKEIAYAKIEDLESGKVGADA